VAQAVRVNMTEPGRGGGEVERSTDPTGSHSSAVDDDQDLDGPLGALVDQWPASAPTADPVVEGVEGGWSSGTVRSLLSFNRGTRSQAPWSA
jgi:hypothetical protein